jgi:rRNA maturation RNase YbeY
MKPGRVAIIRKSKVAFSDAWIRSVIALAFRMAAWRGPRDASVAVIGDAEMRRLNRVHRHKDRTTDVLSFPAGESWSSEAGGYLGDMMISLPQIRRQAVEYGRTLREEFALMLIHGTLHLLGHDHMRPKDAKKMFGLQQKIYDRCLKIRA